MTFHPCGDMIMAVAKKAFVLSAMAWALSACSLAPHYEKPQAPVATQFKGAGIWQQAKPADKLPRGAWWSLYHDSRLDGLEHQVLTSNNSLAMAVAHYDQRADIAKEIDANLYPTVTLGASMARDRQSDHRPQRAIPGNEPNVYNADILGIGVDYEVDLWGQVHNEVAAGRAEAQAAEADLQNVQLSLQAQLADDYMQLRGLDAEKKLLDDTVDAFSKALLLTQERHDGGVSSGLDVARAQNRLASAQAEVYDVLALRALYEHAIAVLVGANPSSFTIAPDSTVMPLPPLPSMVPSQLLERRPDIAAAERRVAAANAYIGVARAAYFPQINLNPFAGYANTSADDWLTAPNTFWSLGPSALVTLFDAGRIKAQVEQSKAQYAEQTARYRGTVLDAFRQVEDALARLQQFSGESIRREQAAQAAEHTEQLAMARYREGIVNYLEVVTAQTDALRAERANLNLRTRQLRASVELVRALGGGWSRAGDKAQQQKEGA